MEDVFLLERYLRATRRGTVDMNGGINCKPGCQPKFLQEVSVHTHTHIPSQVPVAETSATSSPSARRQRSAYRYLIQHCSTMIERCGVLWLPWVVLGIMKEPSSKSPGGCGKITGQELCGRNARARQLPKEPCSAGSSQKMGKITSEKRQKIIVPWPTLAEEVTNWQDPMHSDSLKRV